MSYISFSDLIERRLQAVRFRGATAAALTAVLAFVLIGLVYNALVILRLPQSGLKTLEIIWVSLTACVVVMLLATALAALLEHVGRWLTPKPASEEWLREQLRHQSIASGHAAHLAGEARAGSGETTPRGGSSAA